MSRVFRIRGPKPKFWRRNKGRFARKLRLHKTPAEKALWPLLKPLGFKAQVVICGYIADFAHPKTRLIVEADGEHHNTPDAKEYDELRDWRLFRRGYKVLRFANRDILADPLKIVDAVEANGPSRYSPIPKSNVKSSPRKHVLQRPSVQTATDGVAAVSHEHVVLGSAAFYTN